MIDRIDELRAAGRGGDRRRAGTTAALEELRVRFLGRKAELPEPAARRRRAAAGGARRRSARRPTRRARRSRPLIEARARRARGRASSTRGWPPTASTSRCPATPPQPVGRLHLLTATRREIEDVFLGLGFHVARGPRGRDRLLQLRRAQPRRRRTPRAAATDTFYVSDDVVLRTHTSPMQIRAMEAQPPPLYVVVPGRIYRRDTDATHTPQFHQVEGLAVDEDITLADLKGTLLAFARAIFGEEREVRLRPHFFPFTEPSVEVDVSCFHCDGTGYLRDGSRCPLCKGEGWIEILGAGDGRPERLRATCATTATTPRRSRASPSAWASSGSRCSSTASPTCGCSTRTTCASWSSSDEASRSTGCTSTATPALDAARARRAPDDDRHEGRGASHHHGVGALEHFVVGRVLERRAAPRRRPADASARSTSATASRRRSSAARRTSPPGQTVAVARPGAVMPDGTKLGTAKLRGVESRRDDPGRGRARDRHRPRRDHGPRRTSSRAGHAAGRACCRSPPTCSSSRSRRTGPTASASTASRARSTPRPARRSRRRRGRRTPGTRRRRSPGVEVDGRGPRPLPALHRARSSRT